MNEFQQIAAALYFAAGVGALLGLTLPAPRILHGARWGLGLGAAAQGIAFATLHRVDPRPAMTDLNLAIAFMAWVGVIFLFTLLWRYRLPGFVPPLAFIAFLCAFGAGLPRAGAVLEAPSEGSLPHFHVLLASAGLGLLGVAGLAGFFFLLEHRTLKSRKKRSGGIPLPSLEALDRVNRLALPLGFSMLSLGVITGALWLEARDGQWWTGSHHETWSAVAWVIYLGLVSFRFAGKQGARQAAASAVAGFGFLLFAIVGVGMVT